MSRGKKMWSIPEGEGLTRTRGRKYVELAVEMNLVYGGSKM